MNLLSDLAGALFLPALGTPKIMVMTEANVRLGRM
jgi:hypothetical protein